MKKAPISIAKCLLIAALTSATSATSQATKKRSSSSCSTGQTSLVLVLNTDDYGFENSWVLSRKGGGGTYRQVESGPGNDHNYGKRQKYTGRYCLAPGEYRFTIVDLFKDGMCCQYGNGGYAGYLAGSKVFSSPEEGEEMAWETRRHSFQVARDVPKHYDAVVVGGGWAGLKAAKTLLDNGITSILLLEANEYVGGRAKSVNYDGSINIPPEEANLTNNPNNNVPSDLGAEWLYIGSGDQESYLRRKGFIDAAVRTKDKYTTIPLEIAQFYRQSKNNDGSLTTKVLNNKEANELEKEVWGGFLRYRENILNRLSTGGDDESYADAIDEYSDDGDLQSLLMIQSVGEIEYAGDAKDLSLKLVQYFDGDIPPTHYTSVRGMGFGNVAASFANSFNKEIIRLNSKVTSIVQGSEYQTVSYVDERGMMKQAFSRTTLVTVSLGVLKSGEIQFAPSLPPWKQEAIDGMGFGVINKCIMFWNSFDDIVWPLDKLWFELITPDDESSGMWTSFFNPTEFKKMPALIAWIGGDEAIAIEKKTDNQILDDVMKNLRGMFPTIRRPDKVIVSRWGQEEYIKGSYSFRKVGRNFSVDSARLRRKFNNVWFAGEATAGGGYASTTGAWDSGKWAALEIVSTLRPEPVDTYSPTYYPTYVPTAD